MVLPNDLITEVLSVLPVKSLLRFKCLSDPLNTLISDPAFVKLHLKRSKRQNLLFSFVKCHEAEISESAIYSWLDCNLVPYPIPRLLDNSSLTLFDGVNYYLNNKGCRRIIGSCNGLILLTGDFINHKGNVGEYRPIDYWFCVWNPATRRVSKNFGHFREYGSSSKHFFFAFGCDNSKDTYKVVSCCYDLYELTSDVKVLSLGDDVWRKVETFPVVRLLSDYVYTSETLNWLAIQNDDIGAEKIVIGSFDLRTETFNQYLLPSYFDEVSPREAVFGVLEGCISFSYGYKETHFVIWQMKQFGVQDSWTRLLKVSYENLQIGYANSNLSSRYNFYVMPLFLLNDTLVLMSRQESQAIIYNWRDNRVKRTKVIAGNGIKDTGNSCYLSWEFSKNFVESLVPIF